MHVLVVIFRVYCADHTYCTLRLPVETTAETIKLFAADKLKLRDDDLLLAEVKSNGERVVFKDNDISIPTALSINGRIMVSPKDHLDALVRIPTLSSYKLTFFLNKIDIYQIYSSYNRYKILQLIKFSDMFTGARRSNARYRCRYRII